MNTIQTEQLKIESVKIEWEQDFDPDLSYLDQFENSKDAEERKYYKQDQERKKTYGSQWEMLGCVAKAEVSYSTGNGSRRLEWLTSGGLWGIESDSEQSYLKEAEDEQLSDLANHLSHFGIETTIEQLRELI